jgi:uncharacterized repeat protein (TIGR01451 family)/LPXTG-motif cell wall-anchored protein
MRLSDHYARGAVRTGRIRGPLPGAAWLAVAIVLGGVIGATAAPHAYGHGGSTAPTVAIAMAHEPADPTPGESVSYTAWLSNDSPIDATGYQVVVSLPEAAVDVVWTCRGRGPGSACGSESGTDDITDAVDIGRDGGSVVYSIFATIDPRIELTSHTATARVVPPLGGACDPCVTGTTIGEIPTVVLSKTYHPRDPDPAPGEVIGFRITLTNDSDADATDYAVDASAPAELVDVTWTCSATGARSACGNGSGAGRLRDVADVGANGGMVVYLLTGTVNPTAGDVSFRQHVTLVPGPGQACEPVATASRTEQHYYPPSYDTPPAAETMTCRVNNLVRPIRVEHATRNLPDTGSLAMPYALVGLAVIAGGAFLMLSTRRVG